MSSLTPSPEGNDLWRGLNASGSQIQTLAQKIPGASNILSELSTPLSRRNFLQLLGASAALAGLSACTKMPAEKIIPYIIAPENFVPGESYFYATSAEICGFSKSILARSHEGRPTKLEGNPKHPESLGKSDLFTQGELLQLYDPDRAKTVLHLGEIRTWDDFNRFILGEIQGWKLNLGEGLRILSHHITSPTLLSDMNIFLKAYPKAQWHSYEPTKGQELKNASELVFGKALVPIYNFAQARVIISLDYDFLGPGPNRERHARDFMASRQCLDNNKIKSPEFNRLYMFDSSVTLTGSVADHRWPVKYTEVYNIALTIASQLGVPGIPESLKHQNTGFDSVIEKQIAEIVNELKANRGQSLVIAGEHQPSEVQALSFLINSILGNFKSTITLINPVSEKSIVPHTLETLSQDMDSGKVTTLLILGANPVYDCAHTLKFKEAFEKVKVRLRLGDYDDETSALCHWHLPESHFLESWGDGRTYEGNITFQQPLISPLYDTRSAIDIFSILNQAPGRNAKEAVKNNWGKNLAGKTKESFEDVLQVGFIPNTQYPTASARVKAGRLSAFKAKSYQTGNSVENTFQAVFHADPTIFDGRYSNNGWLQELPKPLLQLTWSNAIVLSPNAARKLKLEDGDEIEVTNAGQSITGPILCVPGHPDESITLYFGYGRTRAGIIGTGRGYDAFKLQNHKSPFFSSLVTIKKTGKKIRLATTHFHSNMEGRDLVVHSDFDSYKENPGQIVSKNLKSVQPSMIPDYEYKDEAWAMSINLSTCIGCNGCTIACQAENNIPVVGEEQVAASREMHWIRVDRYFEGGSANPKVFFQPVPCMQCEKAPCEEVCPTAATNHSSDGLNQMVYNRCVGTRYCSNNCPYKVRRFNWLQYSDTKSESKKLMYNPDVTVRSRGVMEKCTYCIQRIQTSRIQAEKENRPIKDGEIQTACQQACPTNAIIFGDKNDSTSQVSKLRGHTLNYNLLNDLGTQPRTTYLAKLSNPNSKILKSGNADDS